jgi:tetratricopeptide (TPR) repeat protein
MMQVSRAVVVVVGALAVLGGCGSSATRDRPEEFLASDPGEADALIRRGDAAAAKGDSAKAAELYRQAIVIDRDRYVAWNNLAVELMNQGNYLDAVAALKVAADLSPRDPRPVANIGMAYQEMGWAQDALEYYDQALLRDENFLDALRGYALAEETLGQASLRSLDRIKAALMVEKDAQWRDFFERRRFRVEAQLRRPEGVPGT